MPRGFLVKRHDRNRAPYSYRQRHNSDGERSDSSSESDSVYNTQLGSPDSGYSHSPVTKSFRMQDILRKDEPVRPPPPPYRDLSPNRLHGYVADLMSERSNPFPLSLPTTPASSPLAPAAAAAFMSYPGSPFHFSAFDRLTLASPINYSMHDGRGASTVTSASMSSPTKRPLPMDTSSISPSASKPTRPVKTPKKIKAVRRINFDENKSSPISGTIIREANPDDGKHVVCGDIDSSLNFVEVTPEAMAELAKIDNKIGDYVCQLCKDLFDDAFRLAQHKCSRIVHVEYRCPECDKVFNCPANLASHRRWHKPKNGTTTSKNALPKSEDIDMAGPLNLAMKPKLSTDINANSQQSAADVLRLRANSKESSLSPLSTTGHNTTAPAKNSSTDTSVPGQFECEGCGRRFKRQLYLKKHVNLHCSAEKGNIFPCQICTKPFKSESSRTKHLLQHSLPATTAEGVPVRDIYRCKYCTNDFTSSIDLSRHIDKYHPSENRQVMLLQMPVGTAC